MSALFACFLGQRPRRNSSALSEASDFSANGFKNGDGSSQQQQEVVYVELLKGPDQPLGIVLDGGTDRGVQVQVAELHLGGVAEQSGALQIGDHIRSINGTVTEHLTNDEASSLLDSAGNVVNLEIAFDALPDGSQKLDDMELKTAFILLPLNFEGLNGPGFIISGGALDHRPITVSHVKPGSYPYKKGVLRVGDRILQINGLDMRNASQTDFSEALKKCSETFKLQIEYDVITHEALEEASDPFMVELQKPYGASLGMSLSGDHTTGESTYISRVRDAGIADRSGALHVGDRVLSINGQQLEGCTVQEARHMLAHSNINVTIEIVPSHNMSERPGGVSRAEDRLSDTSSRVSHSLTAVDYERRPSRLSLISTISSSHPIKTHPETMNIQLKADEIGFGMSLEGGTTEYGPAPIIISSIEPNGPAERLGQLVVGDRILGINGTRLFDETLQQAYKLIQEGEDLVVLEVEYDVQDVPQFSQTSEFTLQRVPSLQWGLTLRGNREKLWIANVLKGGVASRRGCFRPGDLLVGVNGVSVVNMVPRDVLEMINTSGDSVSIAIKHETINNFGKTDAVIYSVELERGNQSLGISLHGSERPAQPIIISHIKEGGVAHRTRALRAGDRILAINGESLFSKSLDDAVKILQTAGSKVTLKISKGVVSRRRRTRPNGIGKNYRNQRYKPSRGLYPPRVPSSSSRFSHTSDSEMSTYEQHLSESNLVRPLSNTRYSPRGTELGRKSARYNDPSIMGGAGIPGRHSPNNRQRYSPTNKGRSSPFKEHGLGSNKNGVPSPAELRIKKRESFTETTDEETMYDEDISRPRKQNYNGYYYPETSSVENGNGATEWNPMHSSRLPRIPGSLSRERKKAPDRLSPVGKRSPDGPAGGEKRLQLNHQMEEAILKQLEDALLKSKNFVDKLTELANQSGSSDPDSDSEPLKERLRPHLKQQLLKHVREIMIPQQLELIEVKLARSSHSAGFGLCLSDGLLESGVFVSQIQPGGPADVAGLCRYDKLVKFNDQSVKDEDCCKVMPMFSSAGEEIFLTVARNPLASNNNGAAAHSIVSPVLLEQDTEHDEDQRDYC